jgi:hypothetical protein
MIADATYDPNLEEIAESHREEEARKRDAVRRVVALSKGLEAVDEDVAAVHREHASAWGTEEADRRRIEQRLYYERGVLPELHRKITALKVRRAELVAEKEHLERTDRNQTVDPPGSRLRWTAIPVPHVDGDRRFAALEAERTAAIADRDAAIGSIGELEPLIAAFQSRVAEIELKARHGLAKADAVRSAQKDLDDAERALRGYHSRVASSDARLTDIDRRAADLRSALEQEIGQTVQQLIDEQLRAVADLLVPAIAAVYQLNDLFAHPLAPSRTWITGPFNLERRDLVPDTASIRVFLDTAYARGWRPASGGKS